VTNLVKMLNNILAKGRDMFGPRKIPVANTIDIFFYLADLIVAKHGNEPIREEVRKIILLKDLAPPEQESAAEELYIRFEKILSRDYDMEKVRSEIRERFNLDLSKLSFSAKFLTKDERDLRELEDLASAITTKLLSVVGRARLDKLLKDKTNPTLLNGTVLTERGSLDFSAAERRLFKLPPPWLKLGIKFLRQLVADLSML